MSRDKDNWWLSIMIVLDYRNDARETMREREKNIRKLEIEKQLREKEMKTIKY